MWTIFKKTGRYPGQSMNPMDTTEILNGFFLKEMEIDYQEQKDAMTHSDGGKTKTATFFDDDTAWWDDPEHHDLFEGDDETPEELREQLFSIYDYDEKQIALNNMERLKGHIENGEAEKHENTLKEIMNERYSKLSDLLDLYKKSTPEEVKKIKAKIDSEGINSVLGGPSIDTKQEDEDADMTLERAKELFKMTK